MASVVPVRENIESNVHWNIDDYIQLLSSTSISDRYSAAKALSYMSNENCVDILLNRLDDDNEHIYIKLEAAASLTRQMQPRGLEFIEKIVFSSSYLEHRLEAVIILSEIRHEGSLNLLIRVLSDNNQHPEIRAGAAWSLGEMKLVDCLPDLVTAFANVSKEIRSEAARALAKISEDNTEKVLEKFASANEITRPGIAWALSKRGQLDIHKMIDLVPLDSIDKRQWVAFMLGYAEHKQVIGKIEDLKNIDSELYFAVTLLWKIISSWVYNLEEV